VAPGCQPHTETQRAVEWTDGRTDGVEALSVAARRICGGLALAGTG
jgi:hypothetical protein